MLCDGKQNGIHLYEFRVRRMITIYIGIDEGRKYMDKGFAYESSHHYALNSTRNPVIRHSWGYLYKKGTFQHTVQLVEILVNLQSVCL